MPTTSPLEQSFKQLGAWMAHRPPQPIRAHINESWKSEKAASDKDHDSTANHTQNTSKNHSVFVHTDRVKRIALD